ncbi:MAG: undecaprenyl-diphosphate phosphatase [Candidatus Cloacimonetes bacterium]|nr:undecaprenyl-diphosphate phosphatase [Candidatus Cloacimonadota bacterium]
MEIFKSIILGIIQGLSEFLPISSSGHLVLAQKILKFNHSENMSFEVFLHFGTLLSVLLFFRKDIFEILNSLWKIKSRNENDVSNRKIALYLVISTFTTAIIAMPLQSFFEQIFYNIYLVIAMLAITGTIVFFSDRQSKSQIDASEMGLLRSFLIGAGQAMAILPGLSRSGTTISISLFSGIKRTDAAKFSFLLSIPAILGANLISFDKFSAIKSDETIVYLVGGLASFVAGYLVISLLINLIKKRKLRIFAYYCWSLVIITSVCLILN